MLMIVDPQILNFADFHILLAHHLSDFVFSYYYND